MSTTTTTHLLGQVLSVECFSREILEHITHKWSILVLHCLSQGVHRFSELKNRIHGISEKMLAQTLKILEKDGFILRTVYPTVPPKVEYQLTLIGSQVAEKVNHLIDWVQNNLVHFIENKS
ncbi:MULTISPECIES: helix-turn-helix domain-containing protein [unclassified Acinetobacter]|uniref:winged helix-turn-helix transcriptional regulator n=1 Tax=unclassified Acinetobacter TaxID=196816 RepID=UPI002934A85F|nr:MULTISPECIES: helix-turn-helix domain-containing protein [unclassified Acinetobacter]WOE33092.1 helix-turn-helix domain-containing protein [Acinetobacter sp. SAAs470]WOE39919.1 helix-turn-helix domain-containing protein [Acinetobacter sp. SAAs474]